MAAVTSVTKEVGMPHIGSKVLIIRYTKANAGDTYDASAEFTVVRGVWARSAAGATDDPATIASNTTVTLSAGTGAGYAIIWGN